MAMALVNKGTIEMTVMDILREYFDLPTSLSEKNARKAEQAIESLITEARIAETKLWYNEWGNGKKQIGDGSWEEFYEYRIAQLTKEEKK